MLSDAAKELLRILSEPDTRDLTPYPENNRGCYACKDYKNCPDAFMNHAIHCNNYGKWEVEE